MLLRSLILASLLIVTQSSITDYISKADKIRFLTTLTKTLTNHTKGDVLSSNYGVVGFNILEETYPLILKMKTCAHLKDTFKDDIGSEGIYHSLSTWKLATCATVLESGGQLFTSTTTKVLQGIITSDKSTNADIHYALAALGEIKNAVANPSKVAELITAQLKTDDSLPSVGHAIHAASYLGSAGAFAHQLIEDVLLQTDEVDGKFLQWEGGLTTTRLLLTGVLKFQEVKKLTQSQVDKFANYLLSRKSIQHPKGTIALLDAVSALSKSSIAPLCVTYVQSSHVTTEKPDLKIRISNIFGAPYKPAPSSVIAQSATRVVDDVVVLSKKQLTPTSNPTEFALTLNLDPGQYRVGISVGTQSAALMVRVLGPVILKSLEVGLGDSDDSSAPRLTKLEYPAQLSKTLEADSSQHLIVRFSISRPVHQAFVRLSSGKSEIIFVAEQDSSKVYKIDVKLASELKYSSTFQLELILGDSIMSNPIRWSFGKLAVKLNLGEESKINLRAPKPEIKHMFRQAEKRPSQFMSLLFTALATLPLLLLLGLWLKIGINFSGFSLNVIPFLIGLGSIFALFTKFWLSLDMFTTCAWLVPLGGFTFLAGHHLLSRIARSKKA